MSKLFKNLWYGLDLSRKIFLNFLFFVLLIMIISSLMSSGDKPKVEPGVALILQPNGYIVEQLTYRDPIDSAMQEAAGNEDAPETLIYDLIEAIDNAKDDKRITSLVISTNYFWGSGLSKLQDLAVAIEDFKTSGKPVIAFGDGFSQSQYYLASLADEVIMGNQGDLFLTGYSRVGTYFKSMLEKIGVSVHVFKVGTFKSAVEPFIRDNMSDEAREANQQWMGDLWQEYLADVASRRNLTSDDISSYINNFKENLIASSGNSSQMALDAKLVDSVMTRIDFREKMIEMVGKEDDSNTYKHISHKNYLRAIKSPLDYVNPSTTKIAVVTAKGDIMNGERKEGAIGGDTVARLIRNARSDENVKAIVLRVDSGGGSAFASEIIREELEKAQSQGIKVVASMGDVAASGGYWISATADEIWARSSTITGSIGIFAMFPTFEKPLNEWGITRDGVGTTKYATAGDIGMPLADDVGEIIQTSINSGYDDFLSLVARGRNMTKEQVDKVAQGRVWSGKKAHELGLVDKLGSLNDAIKSAAELAGITNYDVWNVKRKLSEKELFLKSLLNQAEVKELVDNQQSVEQPSIKGKLFKELNSTVMQLEKWNDPKHAYAACLCEIR